MPMTQGAIDMSTTEQAVDCVLANHAAQEIEDVALNDDEDVALDLDEPKRCLQTEQTVGCVMFVCI